MCRSRRVLLGLNIAGIGWVLAQNLARHVGNVDTLIAATPEELAEIDGFGPDRAEAIAEWFADEDNLRLVEELRALGLRFESGDEDRPVEGPADGKPVRDHRERSSRCRARTHGRSWRRSGAKVSDSVSKKTTGVFVGECPGSKVAKAEKAGVPLLGEAELLQLIG